MVNLNDESANEFHAPRLVKGVTARNLESMVVIGIFNYPIQNFSFRLFN